jgi:peptide/nickel transport system substrate-binding protein
VRPGSSIGNFNPVAFAQDPQIPLSYLEPLVRADASTMRPEPFLAEGWEWRNGGLELLFTIRDGVVWQDGSPFSAHDAVFSFDVYQHDAESAVSGMFALVESIEADSDRDLIVRFNERDANWLFNAATLPVFSRRQYEEYWDSLPAAGRTLSGFQWGDSPPIGTGPWQVAEWDERRVVFTRSGNYWGARPWLDGIEVAAEVGMQERLEAWVDGSSQLLWPARIQDVAQLSGVSGTLVPARAASVMFAAFNFANPDQPSGSLWTDLRVRRAASLAIDRERYAAEVFDGFMQSDAAGTVAQPWAHDGSLKTPARNLEAASVLLAEAGWIDYDGDGVREDATGWQLRPVAIVREGDRAELAAVLARVARDLASVGIALTVEILPAGDFDDRWIARRNYDLIAYAYDLLPGFTDFDLYGSDWDIRTNPAGWNPGGYANAEADTAIAEFLNAVSIDRQTSSLQRLQRAVDDDLFGLWFGFPQDLILVADGVEGFSPDISWQTARTWDLWLSADAGDG